MEVWKRARMLVDHMMPQALLLLNEEKLAEEHLEM